VISALVDEMLSRASSRTVVEPGDARSGSIFERVVIDGAGYFLKRLSPASDWIMRVTGDDVHRPYLVWRAGIMDQVPVCIDHAVVAMQVDDADDRAGEGPVLSMLMRDVGALLVPEGDTVVPLAQHAGFMEHMAALSARFWGWQDSIGLTPMQHRVRFFAPDNIAAELSRSDVPATVVAADRGWRDLAKRSPLLSNTARAVHDQPGLVTEPLAATPATFLHGDWKMGNIGTHQDGRTILLDWAYPGAGPACWDLCWYLALNRARLPETKEASAARFRVALEALDIVTSPWWDAQFDLCTIAIMAEFGWEKALGDEEELRWWERAVDRALLRQGLAELAQ